MQKEFRGQKSPQSLARDQTCDWSGETARPSQATNCQVGRISRSPIHTHITVGSVVDGRATVVQRSGLCRFSLKVPFLLVPGYHKHSTTTSQREHPILSPGLGNWPLPQFPAHPHSITFFLTLFSLASIFPFLFVTQQGLTTVFPSSARFHPFHPPITGVPFLNSLRTSARR